MEEVVPVTNSYQRLPSRWLRDEATGLVTNKVYADGKGAPGSDPCDTVVVIRFAEGSISMLSLMLGVISIFGDLCYNVRHKEKTP